MNIPWGFHDFLNNFMKTLEFSLTGKMKIKFQHFPWFTEWHNDLKTHHPWIRNTSAYQTTVSQNIITRLSSKFVYKNTVNLIKFTISKQSKMKKKLGMCNVLRYEGCRVRFNKIIKDWDFLAHQLLLKRTVLRETGVSCFWCHKWCMLQFSYHTQIIFEQEAQWACIVHQVFRTSFIKFKDSHMNSATVWWKICNWCKDLVCLISYFNMF